jgi:hypothetical protein
MKLIAPIIAILLLAGCATETPYKSPFPAVPARLMEPPAELKVIKEIPPNINEAMLTDTAASNIQLSTVIKTVSDNFGMCYNYREQIFGLQSWITEQRKLNP